MATSIEKNLVKETITKAQVWLWGRQIGEVVWSNQLKLAAFQYDEKFLKSKVELAPLMMPKNITNNLAYNFPYLNWETYRGLPGMLADSLPDKFGNALIDQWLVTQSRDSKDFSPIERLCYIGERGMGALEFRPVFKKNKTGGSDSIHIEELVKYAALVLDKHKNVHANIGTELEEEKAEKGLMDLISVGVSAGGARAKCIIAYNEKTGDIRSGVIKADEGYEYWILKFDGVKKSGDHGISDPEGYGCREFAYYKMALDCGIEMSECRLLKESGRSHFMTKRFDRTKGQKLHMQSLCAIAHYDYNQAGYYSYEQVMQIIRQVVKKNQKKALEQQFRRAVFNVIGRNQDDHTKNIAFLMNKKGEWSLSPAYDLVYNFNPHDGKWTTSHQMTVNLKRDDFNLEDLIKLADAADIKKITANKIIKEIIEVFKNARSYLEEAGVFKDHIEEIINNLRTGIL